MTFVSKLIRYFPLLSGLAMAQPIMKSGNCPEFTRKTAPENWAQFPVKPNGYDVGTIQNPLTPAQSINCMVTPPELRAELWASEATASGIEPNIAYPQHFTFDERGRMWVVEPRSYPNIIRADKFTGGQDRILILEDTDGDKVMDKVKVFRDGLNLPQGIEVVNGGVVVAMVPYLVFFPNNNDVAGPHQILWSGMGGGTGAFDTHFGISNLMYGLDNWIYGHTGGNGCNADGVACGSGMSWRFRHPAIGHAEKKFEAFADGPSNAWGLGQMEDGQVFQSGATGTAHINHAIRRGAAALDIRTGIGSNPRNVFYPITGDRYLWEGSTAKDGNGWFTSSTTAVSGMQFYTSRLFPKKYWGRFAFTCEGSSKLCNQDSLVESGESWKAMRLPGPARANLVASTDAWFAPLLAKTGPDGAVWVLDWYNYLFLHNPASPSGAGRAWNNQLRVKERYRIYRITPADGKVEPVLNLAAASVDQLVNTFTNPNLHWRLQAQRLLIAKGWSDALGASLEAMLASRSVDAVGNNPRVVHALWTLAGLGRLQTDAAKWNPVLKALLKHPAAGVRRNVLLAMPRTAAAAQVIKDACSVNDPHAHVRLQAGIALAEASSPATPASCTVTLDPAVPDSPVALQDARSRSPRTDLRFAPLRQGVRLLPHSSLPTGELVVYDPRGRVAFRSEYRAEEGRWSLPEVRGLGQPVYLYEFRGADGSRIQGRLAMVGNL